MTQLPRVVQRAGSRAARKAFLIREKECTGARDALNAERRALPMVEVARQYAFDGPAGTAGLADLSGGRRQLIVYHVMSDPARDQGCPVCSFLVDKIGHLTCLRDARDTPLVLVSSAPLARIEPFEQRMGWAVPWYSPSSGGFNSGFRVTVGGSAAPVGHGYRDTAGLEQAGLGWLARSRGERHGLRVFLPGGGRVFRTYPTYALGGDLLPGTCNYLDLTPLGRHEDGPVAHEFCHHDSCGAVRRDLYPAQPAGPGRVCGRPQAGAAR